MRTGTYISLHVCARMCMRTRNLSQGTEAIFACRLKTWVYQLITNRNPWDEITCSERVHARPCHHDVDRAMQLDAPSTHKHHAVHTQVTESPSSAGGRRGAMHKLYARPSFEACRQACTGLLHKTTPEPHHATHRVSHVDQNGGGRPEAVGRVPVREAAKHRHGRGRQHACCRGPHARPSSLHSTTCSCVC
jgi:hypothetical protein